MRSERINFFNISAAVMPAAVATLWLMIHSAQSQVDSFSKTELQQLKKIPASKATNDCMTFEATFSSDLKEKPKAILDIEKLNLIEGALTKILEVVAISPKTYQLRVTDPQACESLKGKQDISVTVTDGKGSDGRPVFPVERSFKTK